MSELPESVVKIVDYLARMSAVYGHMKWNERDQFKADLMVNPKRWRGVDPGAFRDTCLAEGMRAEDVDELVDYLRRAQDGRRLRPPKGTGPFRQPVEDDPEVREPIRRSGSVNWPDS
ncbi:hypothetical protein [Kytococcus sedentarius]|uniref:hypothetical protein n=1 Tax=Kytococcus sedentarius TaxID=1276 RepID=UPI0035BC9391